MIKNKTKDQAVIENHQRYLQRLNLYKEAGYDIEAERRLILSKARPIRGDVLEIGTGKGHLSLLLARELKNFISIDISEEDQKLAVLNLSYYGLGDRVDLRLMDAAELEFEDESFELVISANTLHHLDEPYRVLNEIIRVLREGGRMVISDFNEIGLALISRIHKKEGRVHEPGGIDMAKAVAYLLSKSFRVERFSSKLQDLVIVYK